MTISLKHAKTSAVADGGDTDLVQPSDWNAEHTLTQAADRILGRVTSGAGATEELTAAQVRTLINVEDGATADQSAAEILSALLTVDGTGSLLDADLLDGNEASAFATAAQGALADSALQSSDIGVSVQAWDAQLDSLSSASANGVSLVTAADYAAMRGLLDLEIGTDVQAYSANYTTAAANIADGAMVVGDGGSKAIKAHASGAPGTAAFQNTGTSGANVPLLNGTNTWSAAQTWSAECTFLSTDGSAFEGPFVNLYRLSPSVAANDGIGGLNFVGYDNASNAEVYARVAGQIIDPTNGSEDGRVVFSTTIAGAFDARFIVGAGVYHHSATGGDKGANTINFGAVYDDNSLLTCYVFDAALDGSIDDAKWDALVPDIRHPAQYDERVVETGQKDKAGKPVTRFEKQLRQEAYTEPRRHEDMRKFKARLGSKYDPLDIDKYIAHWREKRHLTSMPNEAAFDPEKGLPTGAWIQRLVETVEIQAVHIAQLHERLKALEGKQEA